MTNLIDPKSTFINGDHGKVILKQSQEIGTDFLQLCKDIKDGQDAKSSMGDLYAAATIPTIVLEKWLAEGYDYREEKIGKTLAKLRAESLDAFIHTTKIL